MAPTANEGLPDSSAVIKKMVSANILEKNIVYKRVVFNQAIIKPPIMEASYFSPKISPPSETHHAPTMRSNKQPNKTKRVNKIIFFLFDEWST